MTPFRCGVNLHLNFPTISFPNHSFAANPLHLLTTSVSFLPLDRRRPVESLCAGPKPCRRVGAAGTPPLRRTLDGPQPLGPPIAPAPPLGWSAADPQWLRRPCWK